ncbi:MAG: hypothetical protein GX422_01575 [Deltaproteobacteria bacterium]|nr:hypothetical protein [Deltaproteobacteria bacterium]
MSRHMQLVVTVQSYYSGDLEGIYPKLARHLGRLHADLLSSNPSLYELTGQLDQVLYRFEGTQLGAVLLRHRENLLRFRKGIQDNIANWNLAQADRLLYSLEDTFDEIERELD